METDHNPAIVLKNILEGSLLPLDEQYDWKVLEEYLNAECNTE